MPHSLWELHSILQRATDQQRHALGELIGTGYGSAPKALCDHISFLRGGAIGQFLGGDYKQLVTDVADRIKLNWSQLAPSPEDWYNLRSFDIERAIVEEVTQDQIATSDVEEHLPELAKVTIRTLMQQLVALIPYLRVTGPLVDRGLEHWLALLATNWQKLLAAVFYIHVEIRSPQG